MLNVYWGGRVCEDRELSNVVVRQTLYIRDWNLSVLS